MIEYKVKVYIKEHLEYTLLAFTQRSVKYDNL